MAIRMKRWTRLEYERLIDLGAFGPEDRLELLGGQLVVREPQGRPHATGIRLAAQALRTAFGPLWSIEAQLPVSLDAESEPEPDVAVVAGGPRDYLASHPSRPALVVELRSRVSRSIGVKRPASTPEPGSRTTGSSTWSTTPWRCTGVRRRILTRRMAGATDRF